MRHLCLLIRRAPCLIRLSVGTLAPSHGRRAELLLLCLQLSMAASSGWTRRSMESAWRPFSLLHQASHTLSP